MKITILTLFPEMFEGPFTQSIVRIAKEKKLVSIDILNIRDYGIGKHKTVDNKPFGGGTGMVMRVDVLDKAIKNVRMRGLDKSEEKIILLDAGGKVYDQKKAQFLSNLKHLILVCGHYEGVDERVKELTDYVISIGDFVVTGGEIPAMLIADSVVRLIPGVLKENATLYESFSLKTDDQKPLLEYPQYTLPREYKGVSVPPVLLSGNHREIEKWKKDQSGLMTKKYRPDLLEEIKD